MKKNSAFSLIELLVSLIILSLVLAAFIPILTKKNKQQLLSLSQDNKESNCAGFDNLGRCLMCSKNNCTLCTTQMDIKQGYFVNPNESCDYIECSTKFSENCKTCSKDDCLECIEGYKINTEGICEEILCKKGEKLSNSSCIPCEDGFYQDLDNHYEKECKPCPNNCKRCTNDGICIEEEKTLQEPTSQLDCPGSYYLRGMCITIRNAGDENGPSIDVEGVKVSPTNTKCTGGYCCWRGAKTAGSCKANKGSTYSPCNRTACQQKAAELICNNYSTSYAPNWQLPTQSDATIIDSITSADILGINGLNFCKNTSNDCSKLTSGYDCCATATGSKYCTGSDTDGSTSNKNKCFVYGYHTDSTITNKANSVRCIAKKVYK